MAEDVILTHIKLDGADQVQDDLKRIGDEGNRAFAKLADAANQQFAQVTNALTKVSESLDRFSRTRVDINTDRANQALENIARVTEQLSRRLETLGQPGSRSLQTFNQTAQDTQQQVKALEGTTVSAFNNIGQSGVSAFTLIKNTINDAISTASNYKAAIAGIFTGGAIGFVVKEIQGAVTAFNDLKKAASDAKIPLDSYQQANFLLRELGVSAKDSTELLNKLGQRAEDFKKVKDALAVPAGATGRRLSIEVDPNTGAVTKTIIQDLTKIGELNQKFKAGGFGDPGSFEALHKYREAMDALQKSTDAAAKSHTVINPFVKTLGRTIEDTIRSFTLAPTTDNLKKVVDEVNKLGDSGKRIEEFKKAFGGAEAPAKALEEALNTNTLDEFIARWDKIKRIKAEDVKSTEALNNANKNLDQALFEVGAATEQGRISLGLMFAPTLAPAIDAVANGIRSLNLDFRKLANDVGKDIGPAIEQLFNIFKGEGFKALPEGNMFKGLVDGFKGLADAARPALDIFNSFFQTSLSLSDVGIGAALTGLVGGFNTLAIAIGAVFTVSTPGMEKFKENLKGIGIDVDGIKERVLNFARGLSEAFKDPGQRSEMFENIKKALEGLPTLILGVVAAFALLRTGAGLLGRALGAAFGVKISAEATLLGVALAQISGVLPTINTLASTFAGIMVGLNASLSIIVGLLGWPIILAAGLVLLFTQTEKVMAALTSLANFINSAFGTNLTGFQVLIGILGVVAVRLGLAALGAGLFNGAIASAGVAAGAAAAGGFAALLATVSRLAVGLAIAAGAIAAFQSISDSINKSGLGTKITDQKTVNEIKDLNIQNRRDEDRKRKATTDEDKEEIQKRIDARKERLKELQAPGTADPAKALDDAAKKTEDSQKGLMDRLLQGWEEYQKKLDELMQKGAESRAKDLIVPGSPAAKPTQTPEDIARLKKDLGPDETIVTVGGRVYRVPKVGGESSVPLPPPRPKAEVEIGPLEVAPAQKLVQDSADATEEVKTATADVGSEIRNNIEWQKLYNEKIEELNRLLATAAERLAKLTPKDGGPPTGLLAGSGQAPSTNVQNVKELTPEEFRRFQDLTDQTNRITEILGGKLDKVVQEQAALRAAWPEVDERFKAIDALMEKFLAGQAAPTTAVAPAHEFLTTATQDLAAAETALQKVSGLLGVGFDGLRGTADLANKTFNDFIGGLRQTATLYASGQQALGSLDNTTKSLDGSEKSLTSTTGALDDAAKRLRDTFDSFTKKLLELRDKLSGPPEKPPGGVEDDVTKTPGERPKQTFRVPDPTAPGGFREITVTGGAPAPGVTGGGARGGGGGGGAGQPGGTKYPPYLDPRTGDYTLSPTNSAGQKNLPVNPANGEPLLTGPGGEPLKTGPTGRMIDPSTGQEIPRSTGPVFSRPEGKKDLGPRLTPEEPPPTTTPKPVPVIPVDPQGQQLESTKEPVETVPVPPLPEFDVNSLIDAARRLLPEIIPLPRPRPEQAPSGEPFEAPFTRASFRPEETGRGAARPPESETAGQAIADAASLLAASLEALKVEGKSPAADAAQAQAAMNNMSDVFMKMAPEVGPEISRRFLDWFNGVVNDLKGVLDTNKIKPPAEMLIPEKSIPVPETPKDLSPTEDLPFLGDGLTQVASALEAVNTAAQSTTTALEPVAPALEEVSTSAQSVPSEVQQAEQSFEQIDFAQAEQTAAQFVEIVNQMFERLSAPSTAGAATGGLITGPGSETSDSIPILASANEFMVRAAAVRHYGRDFMYRINSMSFPRLAMGGLIDIVNTPLSGQIRLPRFADGGPVGEGASSSSSVPVHVNFEGRRVLSATAPRSSIEQLKRESLLQKVRSGGPSPFWVE